MNTYSHIFSGAEYIDLAYSGDFFRILSNTAAVDVTFYRNGAEVGRADAMDAGFGVTFPTTFDRIRITSGSAQTVKFATALGGEVRYDRSVGSVEINAQEPPRGTGANAEKTVTNVSAELVAANAARRYLLIQNKDATGIIYVTFGAEATVANGVRLSPGGSYELNCNILTAAVNAISDIASNANVVVVEG